MHHVTPDMKQALEKCIVCISQEIPNSFIRKERSDRAKQLLELKSKHDEKKTTTMGSDVIRNKIIEVPICIIASMFGSTYICDNLFSQMNLVKTKQRSGISNEHLVEQLTIAMSDIMPNCENLALNDDDNE
ncbi:hypothetical protein ANN_17700 [Periplaneta americana]|uniref:Uncharacterized protein n=1 Tax=Periplaneta americana TaxID=6978 RepID=A0ABQ8SUZ6_PERAM|nr:hypothetical protein ANN_17700 [Periplaneta americana]